MEPSKLLGLGHVKLFIGQARTYTRLVGRIAIYATIPHKQS
jgi:hypothetical protein